MYSPYRQAPPQQRTPRCTCPPREPTLRPAPFDFCGPLVHVASCAWAGGQPPYFRWRVAPGSWRSDPGYIASYQKALAFLGYPVAVDGSLGPHTVAAVRAFQESQMLLEVDGMCGWKTALTLNRVMCTRAGLSAADMVRVRAAMQIPFRVRAA